MKKIHWEPVVLATILAIMGFFTNSDPRLAMTETIYLAVASVAYVIERVMGYNIIFGRYGVTS